MINFDYVKPSSQKAAIDALNKDATAQFIAGGTNLVDLMKITGNKIEIWKIKLNYEQNPCVYDL